MVPAGSSRARRKCSVPPAAPSPSGAEQSLPAASSSPAGADKPTTMSLFYMYIRYIYIIFYSFCCEASPASGGPAVHAGISVTPPASWWHSSASALPAPVQNVSVSPRRPGSVRQIDKEMENVR